MSEPSTTVVRDEERCEVIPIGLFGPARCPQPADVLAHGTCAAGHVSEMRLCNGCRLALADGGPRILSGPCAWPAPTGLPNEYCNRRVDLTAAEAFHA